MSRHLSVVFFALAIVVMAPQVAWARDDWPREGKPDHAQVRDQPIEATAFKLDVPFRTQKDGGRWQTSNCGPATLGMILDGFGLVGQATDDLRFRSHSYQGTVGMRTGTALEHIARVAEDFGLRALDLYGDDGRFRSWTLDDIRGHVRLGRPVMPLVRLYALPGYESIGPRWGHYILITGLADDGFFYSDSLQTDPAKGASGFIAGDQLGRAMQVSHHPGQAVAFGRADRSGLNAQIPPR